MNFQNQIKNLLGQKQTGVKFNVEQFGDYKPAKKPMRLCEAVIASINTSLVLFKKDIDCQGAHRALGFYQNDKKLANHISVETSISLPFIFKALEEIPVMNITVNNIILGDIEKPDILIALVKPDKITKLTILYNTYFEESPLISPYFFMSVCANIAVQTFITRKMCISFGCPESRKYGGVLEDEVIVGFPNSLFNVE